MTATNRDNNGYRVDNDGHKLFNGHIVVADIFCGRLGCGCHRLWPLFLWPPLFVALTVEPLPTWLLSTVWRRFGQYSHLRRSKLSLIYNIDLNTLPSTPPGVSICRNQLALTLYYWCPPRLCCYSTPCVKNNLTKIITTNCSKTRTRATSTTQLDKFLRVKKNSA